MGLSLLLDSPGWGQQHGGLSTTSLQPAILVVCVVLWGCLQSEDGLFCDCWGPGETSPHDCIQVERCSVWDSWAVGSGPEAL